MMQPQPSGFLRLISRPPVQAACTAGVMLILTLIDLGLPHDNAYLPPAAGTWILATALVFCFIILNTVVALRIRAIVPYWTASVVCYVALLVFSYGWCYFLTGRHIDDAGSFRWLWLVLSIAYFIFFGIARAIRRIVEFAMRQDKKDGV